MRTASLDVLASGEALLLRILPEGEEAFPDAPGAPHGGEPVPVGRGGGDLPRAAAPGAAARGRRHLADRRRGRRRSPSRSGSPSAATATGRPSPPAPPPCSSRATGASRRSRSAPPSTPAWGSSGSWPATRGARRCSTALGLTDDERARVRTPIGVEIGATTAEEIALSIMAEVVRAVRVGGSGRRRPRRRPPPSRPSTRSAA